MSEVDEDTNGLIGDLIRIGKIASVDLAAAQVVIACGDIETPPCPWLELAGGFRSWVPPVVGEQVIVLCPEGDIAHAVVLRGLYSTAHPAPTSDPILRFTMPDGATFDYDPDAHRLIVALPAGSAAIDAPAGMTINGDVDITGTLTASVDVVGGGKSLKDHKHSGVQAGSAQTGAPV